jgi:hypothetical protein
VFSRRLDSRRLVNVDCISLFDWPVVTGGSSLYCAENGDIMHPHDISTRSPLPVTMALLLDRIPEHGIDDFDLPA